MTYTTINIKRGFTLVETLVYAVGVMLIIGVISMMLYNVYKWYGNVAIPARVDKVGVALTDRILSDIRSSRALDIGQSSFNVASGAISMTSVITPSTTALKLYALENNRIVYREDGGTTQYVTPEGIYVSQFNITQLPTTVSTAVRFTITIDYNTRDGAKSSDYSGMAIMRNSYQ